MARTKTNTQNDTKTVKHDATVIEKTIEKTFFFISFLIYNVLNEFSKKC